MEKTEVSKHEDRIAVSRVMGTKQMKEGPLKELLAATASATELEQTPKEKPEEENSGSNSQSRKGGFEQLLWWQQILKVKKKKKKAA